MRDFLLATRKLIHVLLRNEVLPLSTKTQNIHFAFKYFEPVIPSIHNHTPGDTAVIDGVKGSQPGAKNQSILEIDGLNNNNKIPRFSLQ